MNRRITIIIAIAFYLSSLSAFAASFILEAESFNEKGGWCVDQQFMDQMGSPYLIAHGLGRPVANASTEITFPEKSRYYIYVRTYNWTSPWSKGKGPGRFSLEVNGKPVGKSLGDEGDQWMWQYAGEVEIKKLKNHISLVDKTGFDGRCDAIYFTTDRNEVPSSSPDSLIQSRNAAPVHLLTDFDLVVAGGGIAGMSAAVSAARLGCKVALINDRPVLGGNNSSEIRVHLGGAIDIGRYPALGSLIKEYGPERGGNAQTADFYEDEKKIDWIGNENNITLFLNYRVNEVNVDNAHISSIIASNIENGNRLEFKAPLFVDCTGDGTVGYLAGADFLYGRESRTEFGEPTAPEQPDSLTMGASVQWRSQIASTTKEAKFPVFEYGLPLTDENCQRVDMGEWTWETGMRYNQIDDAERIRDYGMLVVYSNWSYLKNKLKLYPDRQLEWVAYIAGKRESRRLIGDYILKEEDITKHIFHEDGSFTTTWSIDLHFPDPENSRDFPGEEFLSSTVHVNIYPYTVPYRCLYSRNIDNLFMAGRNISVTHVALGTVRVMRTTGMMGEVVGMAASLCNKHNVLPREIYQHHLPELKELMTMGVAKPGLPNNQQYNVGGRLHHKPEIK